MTFGIERTALVAGAVLVATSGALAQTFTPTFSDRTSSGTVTASCDGTTTLTDAATGFDPFQSYTDVVQECDAGTTNVRAASIQQSQIYGQGYLGWNVAYAVGESPTAFSAASSSDSELVIDIPEPSRVIVFAQFDIIFYPGAPGELAGDVSFAEDGGATLIERELQGIGVLQSEIFHDSLLIDPGSYRYRASATAGTVAPTTSMADAEIQNSNWFAITRQGDVNYDDIVNIDDLIEVILAFGPCDPAYPCIPDVNADGNIDVDDVVFIITRWDP